MPRSIILCLIVFTATARAVYQLQAISTIYIPSSYDSTGRPMYEIDGGAVEQSAYDKNDKIVYGAGSSYVHVVDFSNASNPVILKKIPITGVANDIELCGNNVAVTVSTDDPNEPGIVMLFALYNRTVGNVSNIQAITVGSGPDMLMFTNDCQTIVVANEGEAFTSNDGEDIINPEGTVSIIRFSSSDLSTTPNISTADFKKFNSRFEEFEANNIRYPYKGYISKQVGLDTFSQNIEPEFIAFSSDETKAYIALQENNAIAIVDMVTGSVENIVSMGVKSWGSLTFDASDKDSGINLRSWPVYSLYQPDSMIHYEINGVEYLATANEGDSLEYETNDRNWEEAERGEKLVKNLLISANMSQDLQRHLENMDELGRLKFSTVDGLDEDGKIEKLFHYGGRSWSIFRIDGNNLTMIYDSGDEIERMTALYYPEVFNGDAEPNEPDEETPEDLFDTRSDNKGPECESLTYGEIDGDNLIFIGTERSSSIMVYKLDSGGLPTFQSVLRVGGTDKTYAKLFEERNLGDLDPEDLRFIAEDESPTGRSSLLVTSAVSGTLSLYEIQDLPEPMPIETSPAPSSSTRVRALHVLILCAVSGAIKSVIL